MKKQFEILITCCIIMILCVSCAGCLNIDFKTPSSYFHQISDEQTASLENSINVPSPTVTPAEKLTSNVTPTISATTTSNSTANKPKIDAEKIRLERENAIKEMKEQSRIIREEVELRREESTMSTLGVIKPTATPTPLPIIISKPTNLLNMSYTTPTPTPTPKPQKIVEVVTATNPNLNTLNNNANTLYDNQNFVTVTNRKDVYVETEDGLEYVKTEYYDTVSVRHS